MFICKKKWQVLHLLNHPHGQCQIDILNGHLVAAEETASAVNFHDPKHRQYLDLRRDDSQDLPPGLFL
jgi:hypothetical protein